jgi:hypothetical protein
MAVGIRRTDYATPQNVALTSPTGSGSSVGIVRWRTMTTEFVFFLLCVYVNVTITRYYSNY